MTTARLREIGRLGGLKRKHRPGKPTKCERCGKVQPSAALARAHCRTPRKADAAYRRGAGGPEGEGKAEGREKGSVTPMAEQSLSSHCYLTVDFVREEHDISDLRDLILRGAILQLAGYFVMLEFGDMRFVFEEKGLKRLAPGPMKPE
jgi:hypothetical protein